MMTVRFANTDGDIFTDDGDGGVTGWSAGTTREDLKLGACVLSERGPIIVDRSPRDEVTRLWVRDIVALIKYVRRTGLYGAVDNTDDDGIDCECSTAKGITVFLPRMSHNMFEEAEHQRLFYSIGKDVTLLPV